MNRDENRKKEKAEEKIEHVQPVNTTQDVCKEKNEQMENIGNKVGKEEFDHKKEKKGKGAKITKEELKELQNKAQELDALKDNFLRKIADFENAKKRLIKEKEEFAKFANEKIVAAFLPVLDNLDRALVHSENLVTTDALLAGIQLIKKQID
ncbi:MAG: nucleotide exchange factor GrpE, partial [Candidatus Omnitrophica bacterium]|nr:nucleotide exchange factor GrpE [Candidatus Omnitrophota bacterium]